MTEHDKDAPIVVTYDDGTSVTLPSINEIEAEQAALFKFAKSMGLLDGMTPGLFFDMEDDDAHDS